MNLIGTKDATYYGYVMDEATNLKQCSKKVTITMFEGEKPYCTITNTTDDKWYSYSGTNKSKTLKAECYVAGGTSATIDTSKIVASKGLGTVTVTQNTTDNKNKKNKVMFNIVFKPKDGKYGTEETITIGSGFVTDKAGTTNDSVKSSKIKVDSKKPTIKYNPLTAKENGNWYKSPFKLKMSCTDNNQSGVKTFKVNETKKSNPITITRKAAANPAKWKTSCTDNAGNTSTDEKPYKVKVYSANKACGVKQYKLCRTSACGCQTSKYCTSYAYKYSHSYCSDAKRNTGNDTCKAAWLGALKCRCSKNSSCPTSQKYLCKCWSCHSSSYVCGCKTYKSCRTKNCGIASYKSCWHF
ncbi:MAG: hypothetical protein ACI31R_02280 [Bacilli bacterium]